MTDNEPMTAWSISDVTRHCLALSRELDTISRSVEPLELDAVSLAEDANVAHAQALLKAVGKTTGERDANATIASSDERLAAKIADVRVKAARRAITTLETRIQVARTLIATLRQEISLDQTGYQR